MLLFGSIRPAVLMFLTLAATAALHSGCSAEDDRLLYTLPVPAVVQLSPAPTDPRTEVDLAVHSGVVHAVWRQQRPSLTVNSVWYSSAAVGSAFANDISANAIELTPVLTAAQDAGRPRVVVAPNGEVTAVWTEGVIGERSIAFTTKPAGTGTFGPTSFIIRGDDTTPATDNTNPSAHYDDNGSLHVAWEAGSNIKYRQRTTSGTLANAVTLDNAGTGQSFSTPSNPSVMTDEFENIMVAFEATQNMNGSSRRVIRIAASENAGGTFNLVGHLGSSPQQVAAGNYEPRLLRIPGNRQVAAVIRVGNERTSRLQFAKYYNLGAGISGASIFDLAEHTAPVGQVSGLRHPTAVSWFDATNNATEIWVAWNDNGVIKARVSLNDGVNFGDAATMSTGAGAADSSLRPSISSSGDHFSLAWDGADSTNAVRSLFFSQQLTTGRRAQAGGN
jgi:hypothetical protein